MCVGGLPTPSRRGALQGVSDKLGSMTLASVTTSTDLTIFGIFFYTALFASMGLALFCVATVHKQPHFTEMQKLKWVLFTVFVPIVGPIAYLLRLRSDKKEGLH